MNKVSLGSQLNINLRVLLDKIEEDIASEIAYSIRRYYKHRDKAPGEEELDGLIEAASDGVGSALSTWFYPEN